MQSVITALFAIGLDNNLVLVCTQVYSDDVQGVLSLSLIHI